MPIACDTESSYEKDRDIKSLGADSYIAHPQTDHYLVSLWSPEIQWVGEPSECPWDALRGQELLAHNRSYDLRVVRAIAPDLELAGWQCTADLSSYLQAPRALKNACRVLLGAQVSKDVRDRMKGKDYRQLDGRLQQEVRDYALKDAELCWRLWDRYGHLWPEPERRLSMHTTQLALRGIGLDLKAVETGARTLRLAKEECERKIPWAIEDDLPVTSPRALALECRKAGIEPPVSTDTKSEDFELWERQYGEVPFVHAIQEWRSVNRTLKVLEAMQLRARGDRLPVELKYFGASHTGRWSGGGGLNMQNLPRKPVHGVDCRAVLVPQNGNKLLVADYSQIEARVLLWLVGDQGMLDLLAQGQDLYEAHARRTMGYRDPRPLKEVDPAMRHLAKARVLGLGYGLGATKFARTADLDERTAKKHVNDFRRANPKILQLWRKLNQGASWSRGGTFECRLPSGRVIRYFGVAQYEGELSAQVEQGDTRVKLWGGKLTENLVQATARELLADAILRLEDAGLPVVLHVHDEVVVEAPEAALGEVERIMQEAPEWAEGCPIAVEAKALDRYTK